MTDIKADVDDTFVSLRKMPIITLAILVNLAQIIYTLMDSLNKDMLVERGASVLDSTFMRSFLMMIFMLS
jgi:hypothetical protein